MVVLVVLAGCLALANLRAIGFTLAAMTMVPEDAARTRLGAAAPIVGLILCGGCVWWTFKRRWLSAILCIAAALGAMLLGYVIVYAIAFPAP